MSKLTQDEYDAINSNLSHAAVFHASRYAPIASRIEASLLTVALGNLDDPASVAADALREAQEMSEKICDCLNRQH